MASTPARSAFRWCVSLCFQLPEDSASRLRRARPSTPRDRRPLLPLPWRLLRCDQDSRFARHFSRRQGKRRLRFRSLVLHRLRLNSAASNGPGLGRDQGATSVSRGVGNQTKIFWELLECFPKTCFEIVDLLVGRSRNQGLVKFPSQRPCRSPKNVIE